MLQLEEPETYHFFQNDMPLTKNVKQNIKELLADNKKSGSAKGADGKKRSLNQILAISYSAAGKSNKS